ncbi:hypothetical protein OESDEN_06876 [Oesophagostomum dentatum]|uniref:Uncharacterized protein n=1 Tax=Oesophagostomum dentatum TaxID=61180 RepID=A0A0B1T7L4_OESDE|nr:hypothetical protein OESDEN_06876 [Oesophagostomum dentatum]
MVFGYSLQLPYSILITSFPEAPVCLGISLRSLGEPSSKTTEKVASIMAIVALVMLFKGVRLGWNIWHVRKASLDLEDLQNNPIEVLAETLRKDFLSHIAESGLFC